MNTDTITKRVEEFSERLIKARFLTNSLVKIGKYFDKNNYTHTVTSECGDIEFIAIKDNNISIQICTHKTNDSRNTSRAAMLYMNSVYYGNSVNFTGIYYSPLNKNCAVGGFYDYKIDYPYEHDEAQYFQNLSLYNLPDEEFYIESCKYLYEIKDLEIVSMELYLSELTNEHMVAIDKLLEKMDLNNA